MFKAATWSVSHLVSEFAGDRSLSEDQHLSQTSEYLRAYWRTKDNLERRGWMCFGGLGPGQSRVRIQLRTPASREYSAVGP